MFCHSIQQKTEAYIPNIYRRLEVFLNDNNSPGYGVYVFILQNQEEMEFIFIQI